MKLGNPARVRQAEDQVTRTWCLKTGTCDGRLDSCRRQCRWMEEMEENHPTDGKDARRVMTPAILGVAMAMTTVIGRAAPPLRNVNAYLAKTLLTVLQVTTKCS